MMVFEHQAECPFCHAQMFVSTTKAEMTSGELTEEAAQLCTCDGARLDRGMKTTEKKLQAAIGEGSIDRGFNYIVSDETIAAVRSICEMILMGLITGGVTFCIPGGDSLRLVKDKNVVKVRRNTKHQLEI